MEEKQMLVKSASVSDDKTRVFLEIPGLKENHVVYVHLRNNYMSQQNHSLWTTEAWYTMNHIPQNLPGTVKPSPVKFENNRLSTAEQTAGWKLLFDGQTMSEWHNFNQDKIASPSKWTVSSDGTMHFNPKGKGAGGDLVSNEEYENFELTLEWKISNCGNSGIMFNVVEDTSYCCTYLTGPEMQVLDNVCLSLIHI